VDQSPESVERDGPHAQCERGTRVRDAYAPPESGVVTGHAHRALYACLPIDFALLPEDPPSSDGPTSLRGADVARWMMRRPPSGA